MTAPVNYDPLAPAYHQRYAVNPLAGVAAWLPTLTPGVARALEVGCGTGRWLAELAGTGPRLVGLDFSAGMLAQARAPAPAAPLVQASAAALPFAPAAFDLVYVINALHHFPDQPGFVRAARRLLRPGGTLALVGLDPHSGHDHWYLYDHFPGTREADLARFPATGALVDWMVAAGFERVSWSIPQRITERFVGRAVLESHFIQRHGTSQLALLSEAVYAAALERLRAAIAAAEAAGEPLVFETYLALHAVVGVASAA
ncbi:MAG: class I SAM-dependent methyltransferase [Anaerolineales bacterium]|nr:class I SAM-dependent methyltransferase [Anaerolineales bacterium]